MRKNKRFKVKTQNSKIKFYIGDTEIIQVFMKLVKMQIMFFMPLLKQVPSCEFYPLEAINANIHGTSNTIDAAIKNSVKKLILLSTDKAVYPINAMDDKALAEKVLIAKSKNLNSTDTTLNITRYGNVMNSRGSVIPNFVDQIKNRPLTVTNPEMTRFMMSLEDQQNLLFML